MKRTFEERLKFDMGLKIGVSRIDVARDGLIRACLVEITNRGKVNLLLQPREGDMYTSWMRVTGDTWKITGPVMVWAARSDAFRTMYAEALNATPLATLELAPS